MYPSHLPNPASYLFTLNEFKLKLLFLQLSSDYRTSPVFRWLYENQTEKAYLWSKNVILEWSLNLCDFTIWIPDTHSVRYSDVQYSDGYFMLLLELFPFRWQLICDFDTNSYFAIWLLPFLFPCFVSDAWNQERFSFNSQSFWN